MGDDFIIKVGEELTDQLPFQPPPLRQGKYKTWGNPKRDSLRIIFGQGAYESTTTHAQSEPNREVGGVLLGSAFRHEGVMYTRIDASIRASMTNAGATHVTFTPDSWSLIAKEQESRFPDLRIVGWYHTHPRMDIFLSGDDLFLHEHFFPQPWQVALVVEPHKHLGGFFIWKDNKVPPAHGFYELYDKSDKSLITWRNHAPTAMDRDPGSALPTAKLASDTPTETSGVNMLPRARNSIWNWVAVALLALMLTGLAAIMLQDRQSLEGLRDDVSHVASTIEAISTRLEGDARSTVVAAAVEATLTSVASQSGNASPSTTPSPAPVIVATATTLAEVPTPVPTSTSTAISTPNTTAPGELDIPASATPTVLSGEEPEPATLPNAIPTPTSTALPSTPEGAPGTSSIAPTAYSVTLSRICASSFNSHVHSCLYNLCA
jgi:proteasome lid subunit RPN8/RPN11